jgi:phosphopantothenoylcysteine decarboxylase / phosphopantothenate---cysteine ligase
MTGGSPPSERPRSERPRPTERLSSAASAGGRLSGRRVALCITGSIAAYKAVLVLRLLLKEGAAVDVLLTASAEHFVGAATFSGLTGRPVHKDMFDPSLGGELHVDLAARSDLVLIVPATADLLARLAGGRATDLVTATALCARSKILAAPAMHPRMWEHPATQRNLATLAVDGRVGLIGPVHGDVASGERGVGRMAEPEDVLAAVLAHFAPRDLGGRHVVVTAGPTVEDIDPVRFVSNRSSGKMGFAIAERAAARGARVTLIAGPVNLPTPYGCQRIDVRSAVALRGAVWQALSPDLKHADALVMAAAVGDYRPAESHATKLKRKEQNLRLDLVQNPDILAEVGQARSERLPILVGFAVEADSDERVIEYARGKLSTKRVDLVVANHAADSFGRDTNRATLVSPNGAEALGELPKTELADRIVDWISSRMRGAS